MDLSVSHICFSMSKFIIFASELSLFRTLSIEWKEASHGCLVYISLSLSCYCKVREKL